MNQQPEGSEAEDEAEKVYGSPLCDNPSQNSQDLFSNFDVSMHVYIIIAIVLRPIVFIPLHVTITQCSYRNLPPHHF